MHGPGLTGREPAWTRMRRLCQVEEARALPRAVGVSAVALVSMGVFLLRFVGLSAGVTWVKRAFPVKMSCGIRYRTVLDDEQMEVVPAADRFLRNAGFGQVLAAHLSAHRTTINGSAVCAERLSRNVTESAGSLRTTRSDRRLADSALGAGAWLGPPTTPRTSGYGPVAGRPCLRRAASTSSHWYCSWTAETMHPTGM